jgi:hypothetical protein
MRHSSRPTALPAPTNARSIEDIVHYTGTEMEKQQFTIPRIVTDSAVAMEVGQCRSRMCFSRGLEDPIRFIKTHIRDLVF